MAGFIASFHFHLRLDIVVWDEMGLNFLSIATFPPPFCNQIGRVGSGPIIDSVIDETGK